MGDNHTAPTHAPCCPAHGASVDCDTFRRTHTVEPGSDCCPTWTAANPYGGWVPRGCPAGFSSDCGAWTAADPCRCLLMTMPFNEARAAASNKEES